MSGCTNGHAIRLQQSKYVTLRRLTITGARGQAIALLGKRKSEQAPMWVAATELPVSPSHLLSRSRGSVNVSALLLTYT